MRMCASHSIESERSRSLASTGSSRDRPSHLTSPHLGKSKRPNVTTRDEHAPEAESLRARYPKRWLARKAGAGQVEVRGGLAVDDGKPIGETFVVTVGLSLSQSSQNEAVSPLCHWHGWPRPPDCLRCVG